MKSPSKLKNPKSKVTVQFKSPTITFEKPPSYTVITSVNHLQSQLNTTIIPNSITPSPKGFLSRTIIAPPDTTSSKALSSSSSNSSSDSLDDNTEDLTNVNTEEAKSNTNDFFPPDASSTENVKNIMKIKECTIIKYGIKPSTEVIEYSFCSTCDVNMINPICSACIKECHKEHDYVKNYIKGKIKCYCGEKMHCFSSNDRNVGNDKGGYCSLSDWKINYYYKTKNERILCVFCFIYCCNNTDEFELISSLDKKMLSDCNCINDHVHSNPKAFNERLSTFLLDSNLLSSKFQSTHLINLVFQSTQSFNKLYKQFNIAYNRLCAKPILGGLALPLSLIILPNNFIQTNTYHSFSTFANIIAQNKNSGLRYYNSVLEAYFSFDNIKKIINNQPETDNISFYSLGSKLLKLFIKIFIGNHTSMMDKYKLCDLENLTPPLRLALFHWNRSHFPLFKDIISYSIDLLNRINIKGFKQIEAYEYLTEVIHIVKRLSIFNIISNSNMLSLSIELEKLFNFFAIARKHHYSSEGIWDKESPLFLIIVKMLHYNIYSFNDKIIRNVLRKQGRNVSSHLDMETVGFIYTKTDLGRMIARITMRVMGVLTKHYLMKSETKVYKKIMRHSIKILEFLLDSNDGYMLSLRNLIDKTESYVNIINLNEQNSQEYRLVNDERCDIEEGYRMYYSFMVDDKELIEKIINSINKFDQIISLNSYIIKSNYFNSLMKIIRVIPSNSITKELIEKLILFYNQFITNNVDNSLLLLSYYLLTSLTLFPSKYAIEVFKLIDFSVEIIALYSQNTDEFVMSFSKQIIKICYDYLKTVNDDIDECLKLFLKIMHGVIIKVKCLRNDLTINKAKKILIDVNLKFPSAKGENFNLYLKLINRVFDPTNANEREAMIEIQSPGDAIDALKILNISLELRKELLVFVKHNVIDAMYNKSNDNKYVESIMTCEDRLSFIKGNRLISNFHYPTKQLSFYKEFINDDFDNLGYEVLYYEMTHVREIINNNSSIPIYQLQEYFEDGIILPSAAYFRKAFTKAHSFTGDQLLCLTELLQLVLSTKLYLGSLKLDFNNNRINSSMFYEFDLNQTELEYNVLDNQKASPFDYTNLYRITREQLFNIINTRPAINLMKDYEINTNDLLINIKGLKAIEDNYFLLESSDSLTESTKRMLRLYCIYKHGKLSINNNHSCLFSCLNEICLEFESNFRYILITILINMKNITQSSYFLLYKLLTIQTTQTQSDLIAINSTHDLIKTINDNLHHILTILFIESINDNQSIMNKIESTALINIKVLKFLCEEHNNFFQGRMMALFDFLLHVLAKLILISEWEESIKERNDYYYDLYSSVLELLIEVIQGNKAEVLQGIGNEDSALRQFVLFTQEIMFKDDNESELILKVRYELMLLYIAILEEKNCGEEIKKFIMKHLNINKVLKSIGCVLKGYYNDNQKTKNNLDKISSFWDYENLNEVDEVPQITRNFNYDLYIFFKEEYFHKEFNLTYQFKLSNVLFHYIKLLAVQKLNNEAIDLIKRVSHLTLREANKKFNGSSKGHHSSIAPLNLINENVITYDEEFIEKYYLITFFEGITEVVEVSIGNDCKSHTVIFTSLPEMIYLSEGTKTEFLQKVNRDSDTTKKNALVRHVKFFKKEIAFYKKRRSFASRLFAAIDFTYVQIFFYLYAGGINLFMLITLEGDQRLTPLSLVTVDSETNDKIISASISKSIMKWGESYNILVYLFVILNGIMITLWILFRMPLYYRLDKIAYMSSNSIQHKSSLSFLQKIKIAIVDTIYNRDYITTLIYMFIVSLVGAILNRGEIAYPFLLLTIINLNPTLKNIIVSVKMKYLELLLTYLLAFIIMYIYSNIGFFFFNEDFNAVLDGYDDNFCHNLVFCFLSTLDYALRNRGGVGDLMIRISYERNKPRYLQRFFYDVTFFLLIVIIMIDLVFGILIGAFQELRNKEVKYENDKVSHCFLCHVNRGVVEKNRQDFGEHRTKRHNVWSYVSYMMMLKMGNVQEMNAVDSEVKEKLEMGRICWLPTYQERE